MGDLSCIPWEELSILCMFYKKGNKAEIHNHKDIQSQESDIHQAFISLTDFSVTLVKWGCITIASALYVD